MRLTLADTERLVSTAFPETPGAIRRQRAPEPWEEPPPEPERLWAAYAFWLTVGTLLALGLLWLYRTAAPAGLALVAGAAAGAAGLVWRLRG